MFTIKHIHIGGDETLMLAKNVEYNPRASVAAEAGPDTKRWRGEVTADGIGITDGTVFVMNEMGKTVARYDLGASPVPLRADDPVPFAA